MADYRYINMEYAAMLKEAGLLDFERLIQWSDGRVVSRHDGRRCLELSSRTIPEKMGTLFLRQERRISWKEFLGDLVRFRLPASRAVKMLGANELFSQNDLNVAPLYAVIERRYMGRPRGRWRQARAPGHDIYTQLLLGTSRDTKDDPGCAPAIASRAWAGSGEDSFGENCLARSGGKTFFCRNYRFAGDRKTILAIYVY